MRRACGWLVERQIPVDGDRDRCRAGPRRQNHRGRRLARPPPHTATGARSSMVRSGAIFVRTPHAHFPRGNYHARGSLLDELMIRGLTRPEVISRCSDWHIVPIIANP